MRKKKSRKNIRTTIPFLFMFILCLLVFELALVESSIGLALHIVHVINQDL
jgi:hypothetical protein